MLTEAAAPLHCPAQNIPPLPVPTARRSIDRVLRRLLSLLVVTWIGVVHADPNPYFIGASVGMGHDSNVFRLPSAVSDTYYSAGVLAGVDQTIGRQRVYASGTVRENRFQDLKQLDHTNYSLIAGVDWETIERLSGALSFSGNQSLFNYGGTNTLQSTIRNLEKRTETIARIKYGETSLLVLDGSFIHRSQRYSDPAYRANALTQDAASVGVSFRPSAVWTVGTGLRFTRGKYESTGKDFDRRDVDLTAKWVPSGLSTFNGRLSLGRREASTGTSEYDFSGTTGQLTWTYRPTGKLLFNTSISRDSGAESAFLTVEGQQIGGIGDSSRITKSFTLNSIYTLSSKIRVDAGVRIARRSLVSGSLEGSDALHSATLGASYAVLRNASLSCSVGRETRSASGPLSFGYGASTVSCSAQIKLQ